MADNGSDFYWNVTDGHYPTLSKVVETLHIFYIPTVIVIGLIANLLSFVVFVSTYLNRLSLSVYLASLAVADSGFLCALSVGWLDYVGVALFHANGWCQATIFTSYVSGFLSAWFVVSYTVERYIAICHPLKRQAMCTVRRATGVVVGLSLFAAGGYSVTLKVMGVQPVGEYIICHALSDYIGLYRAVTYSDTVVTFVIPVMTIVGFNVKILKRIIYFYKQRKNDPTINHIYCPTTLAGHRNSGKVCQRNRAQVEMTKFLLIKSTVFLVINTPVYVMRIIAFVNNVTTTDNNNNSRLDILLQQFFQFLVYLNFSINFFLYNICSKKFRKALLRFCRKVKYSLVNMGCISRIRHQPRRDVMMNI